MRITLPSRYPQGASLDSMQGHYVHGNDGESAYDIVKKFRQHYDEPLVVCDWGRQRVADETILIDERKLVDYK